MSRIDELIKEKCSNGVKYVKLKNIVSISTGKLNANSMVKNGKYLFFTCDAVPFKIDTYAFDGEAILISGNGSQVGHLNYYIGKFNAYQRTYVLMNFEETINGKFLFHYLKAFLKKHINDNSKKGSVPYITLPMLTEFKIPVPPMEVQEEIVRILDKFSELEAELEAELEVRKKQYEFWNKKLYEFTNDIKYFPIEQVCNFLVGGDIPKDNFSKNKTDIFSIPIYSNGVEENALYGYTNRARINQKCVTVSARGTIGYSAIRETPFYPIVRLICVIPNNKLNVRFLKYYFDTLNFKVPTTGIPQLTVPMLKKYNVPVPSLAEQELIVKNLDKFDKLINDISEGIPAEIEARRKQYDYYRNKLLSFEVQDNDRTTK